MTSRTIVYSWKHLPHKTLTHLWLEMRCQRGEGRGSRKRKAKEKKKKSIWYYNPAIQHIKDLSIYFLISMRRSPAPFVIPRMNRNIRKSASRHGPSSNLRGNSSKTRNAELLVFATSIPKTWLIDLFFSAKVQKSITYNTKEIRLDLTESVCKYVRIFLPRKAQKTNEIVAGLSFHFPKKESVPSVWNTNSWVHGCLQTGKHRGLLCWLHLALLRKRRWEWENVDATGRM